MQYSFMCRGFGTVVGRIIKKSLPDKKAVGPIRRTYRDIIERAKDIGSNNTLLFSYTLAAFFIAMNRVDGLTPEENYQLLDKSLRQSRLFKALMGDAKGYFSEEHMKKRREWSRLTHDEAHCRTYTNDWQVDVIEGNGDFVFGFDYTQCGVVKLCQDEGCPELATYLCRLDFMLVEIIGIKLKRTGTLADGADHCDFRFYESN